MRVRMNASISGTVDGHVLPRRGSEVDLPDHVATDLVSSGAAVPVPVEEPVEEAVAPTVDVEERADDLDALRAAAEAAGVKVDKRWGADRLREEIAKASEEK